MTVPILAGAAAFLVLLLSDYAEIHSLPALKLVSTLVSAGLLGYAILACALDPWKARLPVALRIASGSLGVVFLALLIRSLFLEIPSSREAAAAEGRRRLVTTGTYALVRHPGVLWFLFLLLGASAASDSLLLLVATPVWTGIDLAYAAVQDRFIFPRIFGDVYRDYRRVTPFIIPSPRSLRECYETWNTDRSRTGQGDHHGNGV